MSESSRNRLGNYELLGVIGDGAEGRVFKAVCLADGVSGVAKGEFVALKLLRHIGDDKEPARFRRQAEILRGLNHPGVVSYKECFVLRDNDWDEERYCLVTELLEGETLKSLLEKNRKGLLWEQAQNVLLQTLQALQYVSGRGVIHRDLKPSNIFITHQGVVKLIDFGIARNDSGSSTTTSSTAGIKGAFDYMSPDFVCLPDKDNFRGDEQSDIFSFGICIYQLLTGRLPFPGFGENALIGYVSRWHAAQPPEAKFRDPIFRVLNHYARLCVEKSIHPNRNDRFGSFKDVIACFEQIRGRRLEHGTEVYEFAEYLGQGGFGEVFRAQRLSDGSDVAIKRMFSNRQSHRFVREAKLLRNANHPNLVRYLEFLERSHDDGEVNYYLVLEYLKGGTLRDRIKQSESGLSLSEVLLVFIRYLNCLEYLHQRNIIHRDIKPGNLYAPIGNPRNSKIFDLGIALDPEGTRTHGHVPGTLEYMAPEFAGEGSERGTAQSDIYSLGVTLYQSLTKQLPFPKLPDKDPAAWIAFIERAMKPSQCPNPGALRNKECELPCGAEQLKCPFEQSIFSNHPALAGILRRSLAYDPKHRYASASEMARALQELSDQLCQSEAVTKIAKIDYDIPEIAGEVAAQEVFSARRRWDGLDVLFKCLPVTPQTPRFLREIEVLKQTEIPHVIRYLDSLEVNVGEPQRNHPHHYVVLESLGDISKSLLRQRVSDSSVGLDFLETITLFLHFLDGLEQLHRMGLVHRAITPLTLYAPAGFPDQAKVLDLGLARDEKETEIYYRGSGLLDYLPPEYATGGTAAGSIQSDIFSVGVALFEALTNQLPFPKLLGSETKVWSAYYARAKKTLECSFRYPVFQKHPELVSVLRRALASNPADRYVSALEMRSSLQVICEEASAPAVPAELVEEEKTRITAVTAEETVERSTGETVGIDPDKFRSVLEQLKEEQATRSDEKPAGQKPAAEAKKQLRVEEPARPQRLRSTDRAHWVRRLVITVAMLILAGISVWGVCYALAVWDLSKLRHATQFADITMVADADSYPLAEWFLLLKHAETKTQAGGAHAAQWSAIQNRLQQMSQSFPLAISNAFALAVSQGDITRVEALLAKWREAQSKGVSHDGHEGLENQMQSELNRLRFRMVAIASDPSGAEIFDRGTNFLGVTPLQTNLLVGAYELSARYPGLAEQHEPLQLTPNDRQETVTFQFPNGGVQITSEPSGVNVFLNGKNVGKTPYTNRLIDSGTVVYQLDFEGYLRTTIRTNITKHELLPLHAVLVPLTETVELLSDPEHATVFWNGKELGNTPLRIPLPLGKQQLIARYANLPEQSLSFFLSQGEIRTQRFVFPHGGLVIESNPSGATVLSSGRQLGSTPYTNNAVNLGWVEYELRKDDKNEILRFQISERDHFNTNITLRPNTGTLQLLSEPPGARIFIHGETRELGITPFVTQPLHHGAYQLEAQYDNLESKIFSVKVERGSEKTNWVEFAYGSITLTIEPAATVVVVNGKTVNQLPYFDAICGLGTKQYKIQAEDYISTNVMVEIVARQTNIVNVVLRKGTGWVSLTSNEPGVTGLVDGIPVGVLPVTTNLVAGEHNFVARDEEQRFSIPTTLRVKMDDRLKIALPLPKREERINGIGMMLVKLSRLPGTSEGGWVGKYAVTQAEYEKVMGQNPSKSKNPRQPVESVSWKDAIAFCARLTDQEKATLKPGQQYTLPTENQWQYLKADATWDATNAVYNHDPSDHPWVVGGKQPNRFGLYDILGNIWALCQPSGGAIVVRGGCFESAGISDRQCLESETTASRFTGFRVVLVPNR